MKGNAAPGLGRTHPLPLGAIPGQTPDMAIRVRDAAGGQICLEQLAYSPASGWHVQKTFAIPCAVLPEVLREMRKIDCLRPQAQRRNLTPNAYLRLVD
jgi:hypothetical protein